MNKCAWIDERGTRRSTKDHRVKRCDGFTIENFTAFFYVVVSLIFNKYTQIWKNKSAENERTIDKKKTHVHDIEWARESEIQKNKIEFIQTKKQNEDEKH